MISCTSALSEYLWKSSEDAALNQWKLILMSPRAKKVKKETNVSLSLIKTSPHADVCRSTRYRAAGTELHVLTG
jgi:hypothetical protein